MHLDETEQDQLLCGIIKIDQNRKVLFGNRYALDLLSFETEDAILGLSIENLVSVATRILIDSYVYPMLLDEGKAQEIQLSLKTMTGEAEPIVANIRMNPDKTSYWTFMSCVNRDKLFDEMLNARDTLHSQALNLTQLNDKILERQSDLQVFCHSLSHDFTGPLLRISQLIEVALEDLRESGVEAPEEFEILNHAQTNSNNLVDLTNGLVNYLVADSVVSLDEEVNLEEVVSLAMDMRDSRNAPTLKVDWTSLPMCFGSKAQIQMIFKNLIDNAIKYNKNDPEIFITHTVDADNGKVLIAIKDNGIGIPEKCLESIFTPFMRLNPSAQYKGNGLGLSIVKKMVLNHNGDIRVESTLGSGSTFYITLPLKPSLERKSVNIH